LGGTEATADPGMARPAAQKEIKREEWKMKYRKRSYSGHDFFFFQDFLLESGWKGVPILDLDENGNV
jgi:hypothetical protein